jgi:uncharacterized protein YjbJ (UPF0337 family)
MNESNVSGKFDQVKGKVKEGIGEAVGNENLANEGAADQVKGHAKEAWGNVKDAASDLHDSAGTDSHARAEEAKLNAERKGSDVRDSITSAAEHTKDSINRGIDHLKGNDRA